MITNKLHFLSHLYSSFISLLFASPSSFSFITSSLSGCKHHLSSQHQEIHSLTHSVNTTLRTPYFLHVPPSHLLSPPPHALSYSPFRCRIVIKRNEIINYSSGNYGTSLRVIFPFVQPRAWPLSAYAGLVGIMRPRAGWSHDGYRVKIVAVNQDVTT